MLYVEPDAAFTSHCWQMFTIIYWLHINTVYLFDLDRYISHFETFMQLKKTKNNLLMSFNLW